MTEPEPQAGDEPAIAEPDASEEVQADTELRLISVVLPAHDEAEALPIVVEQVLDALGERERELIVVDDGSRDGTWGVIGRLHEMYPEVRGLRFTRNFGHQAAILAGLIAARGDAVIMMDADGQHPPELIPALLARWEEGAAVVQVLRVHTVGVGLFKRIASRGFYWVSSRLAAVELRPGSADFRLLSRPALETVLEAAGPLLFLRGLIPWLGLPTAEVPYEARRRVAGRSSYTLRRQLRLSIDGILAFSVVPLRLAIGIGALVSLFSFLYLIYVVAIRLGTGLAVSGWASTAGLLSLLGGIQLLTLGILGEYLGRIFLANLQRPRFVVRDRLGKPPA